MNEEEKEELYRIYGKIASSWLELAQLITLLRSKREDIDRIVKVQIKLKDAIDLLLFEE